MLKRTDIHCRCKHCRWSFTIHAPNEALATGYYPADTSQWRCPCCGHIVYEHGERTPTPQPPRTLFDPQ